MPVQLGDAVLTFLGDSTQLELAFDKVEASAETKLGPAAAAADAVGDALEGAGVKGQAAAQQISGAWQRVAQATIQNQQAQKALAVAMDAVKKSGGEDVVAMLALAQAQQAAAKAALELKAAQQAVGPAAQEGMGEARGEVMLLNKELHLGVDRHLAGWISKLPGVGAALNAAFGATAVLVLLTLLAEGVNKLLEWSEQAEKIREAWAQIDSDFRDTSLHIQDEINKQEEAFIRLTKGPIAAMDFSIAHLRSTAEETLKSVATELDAVATQLDSEGHWYQFGQGAAGAAKEITKFKTDLVIAMHAAADENPGDTMAAYRKGVELTQIEVNKLTQDLKDAKEWNDGLDRSFEAGAEVQANAYKNTDIIQKRLTAFQNALNQFNLGIKLDDDRQKAEAQARADAAAQHVLDVGSASINAQKSINLARLSLNSEFDKIQYERGKISFEQMMASQIDFENNSYLENKRAIENRLALLNADKVKNEAAIKTENGALQVLEATHQQTLFALDQEGYAKRASIQERGLTLAIAATKNGTQERIDLETQLALFLLQTWGSESDAYQQQLVRVAEARKAYQQEQLKINEEDRKQTLALASDKKTANEQYYQYLVQTARISNTTLRQLQNQEYEAEYTRKVQALIQQRDQLGPQEVLARKQINDQIALLDQQAQEHRQFFILQTNDEILDSYKQLGIKSSEEQQREADLAKEAYDKIRNSGVASYHDILEAKKKMLELQLSAALATGDEAAMQKFSKDLKATTAALDLLGLSLTKVNILSNKFFDSWHKQAPKTRDLIKNMAEVGKQAIEDLANAEASAIQSWILGQESLGTALRKATAQILAEYAARAAVEAIYWLAYGFAMLASQQYDRASAAFTAAAMLGTFAVVAGGIAAAINPKTAGATGSSGGPSVTDGSATAGPAAPNPVQTVNVQSFARSGLISRPTLAVIGDNIHGSSQTRGEVAASLDDPAAMKAIGDALAPHLQQSGTNIHVEVKGLISPDNLSKVVNQISKKVGKGQVNLVSSNSFRVTKRSV
jgi:hypothetical protein